MNYSSALTNNKSFGFLPQKPCLTILNNRQKASRTKAIYISDINDKLFLTKPITARYQYESGYYYVVFEQGPMLITVADKKLSNLAPMFKAEIADSWEYYAKEDDDNLTTGAIEIKRWLNENVVAI